jgi:hypothetical protein
MLVQEIGSPLRKTGWLGIVVFAAINPERPAGFFSPRMVREQQEHEK